MGTDTETRKSLDVDKLPTTVKLLVLGLLTGGASFGGSRYLGPDVESSMFRIEQQNERLINSVDDLREDLRELSADFGSLNNRVTRLETYNEIQGGYGPTERKDE